MRGNGDSFFKKLKRGFNRTPQNQHQLLDLLEQSHQKHVLTHDALQMIRGVLQVSKERVRDIMVSRAQMVVIEDDMTPEQAMPLIIKSSHSRFPVISDNRDEVVGILLAKDLLPYCLKNTEEAPKMRDLVRPAIFIPESKRLDILLKEFRLNHNHMAIVVDEFGGVAGLVTIEDVLEQIVGDIVDEYDVEDSEDNIKKVKDNEFWVKALTPLEQFDIFFNSDLNQEEFDTIGGLVMQRFGHLPKRNESVELNPFVFTVLKATKRRVVLLKVSRKDNESETD